MEEELEPGVYVVAVSGGVDSVVLLDLLSKKPNLKLVVAHLDHGIRHDSHLDRQHVQLLAKTYGHSFVYDLVELGPEASEEIAREARYKFLNQLRDRVGAKAIITAHHQDDMIETAIHNLLRGTGPKGVSSLKSIDGIKRPLLAVPKQDLKNYAKNEGLKWREDPSNEDIRYRRNYIRHHIVPKLNSEDRYKFLTVISKVRRLNEETDLEIAKLLQNLETKQGLDRKEFVKLPHIVSLEVMAAWLRSKGLRSFDRKTLERLVVSAKTLKPGKKTEIYDRYKLKVGTSTLSIGALDMK